MAYSDFDLRRVVDTFGLRLDRDTDLFERTPEVSPGEHLRRHLEEMTPVAIGINSEQARREFIVGPLLLEAVRSAVGPARLLPGLTLDVDRPRGLSGVCDYLITRSAEYYYLKAPCAAVVEAKSDDVISGLGQCAAELVAVRIFNDRDGTAVPAVHGCVTSGNNWKFLRLSGDTLTIDRPEYHLVNLPRLLGIVVYIIDSSVPVA